jgi:hypothetical protein
MPAQPQETQGLRTSTMPVERPLIAVSTSEIRRSQAAAPTPQGEPPQHEIALGLEYLRAIEAAGGVLGRRASSTKSRHGSRPQRD